MTVHKNKLTSGFTLIELLIVIAILGVLAVVVLVAINPVEQLARTRDAGRESGVTQMGHALEAYAVGHGGTYPAETVGWSVVLEDSGEISKTPAEIKPTLAVNACIQVAANSTWCYDDESANVLIEGVLVFAALESVSKDSLCEFPDTQVAWSVYSSNDGRGGVVCTSGRGVGNEPAALAAGDLDFRN